MEEEVYFKLFNEEENHHGFQYQDGLNTDTLPFSSNPEDSCVPGGLYFSDAENIMDFMFLLNKNFYYIREVEVPEGELIIKTHTGKCRAHSLFLHKRRSLYEAETWKWLKEQGVNIDVVDSSGRTALMMAVSLNRIEIVKMLIAGGVNLDIQDNDGVTALMYAAFWDRKEIVKILVDAGANTELKDSSDNTALSWAEYF